MLITLAIRSTDRSAVKFGRTLAMQFGGQSLRLNHQVLNLTPERRLENSLLLGLVVATTEKQFLAADQRVLSSTGRAKNYCTGQRVLALEDLNLSEQVRATRTNLILFDESKTTFQAAIRELVTALLCHSRRLRRPRKAVIRSLPRAFAFLSGTVPVEVEELMAGDQFPAAHATSSPPPIQLQLFEEQRELAGVA